MEEEEIKKFSWPGLFLVTSFCFFTFSLFLKFLEGTDPGVFLWVGIVSFFLGLVTGAGVWLSRVPGKNNQN